jgi:hypothetical protein
MKFLNESGSHFEDINFRLKKEKGGSDDITSLLIVNMPESDEDMKRMKSI